MKNVLGIIFAENPYGNLNPLTDVRPEGAVPFAGRYRLIDFTLSNMVNSGMNNVAIVTQHNYHSLMGHLGSGKAWNLARKKDGLTLFPPFSSLDSSSSDSRIDIIFGVLGYLRRSKQEYVLLSESNIVANVLLNDMFEKHLSSHSDITIGTIPTDKNGFDGDSFVCFDKKNKVTSLCIGANTDNAKYKYAGYILINKNVLINIIENSKVRGKKGFLANIIAHNIGKLDISNYSFKGYFKNINDIDTYCQASFDLLDEKVQDELFNPQHAIYCKEKDNPPTIHGPNCQVKNSFVADGCTIEGKVENSIIFRGTTIGKGSIIKNSIILTNSVVGNNVTLTHVLGDKKVVYRDATSLVGTDSFKVIIPKGKII